VKLQAYGDRNGAFIGIYKPKRRTNQYEYVNMTILKIRNVEFFKEEEFSI
jgi:hypothetical protein